MATHDQFTRITTAPQGANLHYLPTANITPLPRKTNVGRLPKGVTRFASFKRIASSLQRVTRSAKRSDGGDCMRLPR